MIEFLSGSIKKMTPVGVIIVTDGVGYGVEMPLTSLCELSSNQSENVALWIYTRVREDAIKLYGFLEYEEREVFSILLSLSGVGPKVALAILSTLGVKQLIQIVEDADVAMMQSVPGIGKRTAEKILVELKSKKERLDVYYGSSLPVSAVRASNEPLFAGTSKENKVLYQDILSALINLGYNEKTTGPHIKEVLEKEESTEFTVLLKEVLLSLRSAVSTNQSKAKKTSVSQPKKSGLPSEIF